MKVFRGTTRIGYIFKYKSPLFIYNPVTWIKRQSLHSILNAYKNFGLPLDIKSYTVIFDCKDLIGLAPIPESLINLAQLTVRITAFKNIEA